MNMTMTQENKKEFFQTADLPLAAALCASGFFVEDVKKIDIKRSTFIFIASKELEEKIKEYWRGEMRLEPQNYFNHTKALKVRIFAQ